MPAEGYTWKTTPDLNRMIQEKYSQTPLSDIQKLLLNSYQEVQIILAAHSEEELFTKKRYGWTGTSSLGQYLISATCSHYEWALRLIKKRNQIKRLSAVFENTTESPYTIYICYY